MEVIILAAGQGTRMKSALPKVLHAIGGEPMLARVYRTARLLEPQQIHIVYGHGADRVREQLGHLDAAWALQDKQLGTGHAVAQAMPAVNDESRVLILYGDVPLIEAATLDRLVDAAADALAVLTIELDNPTGYGRMVRDRDGRVQRIVEQKDASEAERAIREVNTGLLAVDGARLRSWLERLDNHNVQGEYYLTDIIAMAVEDGVAINTVSAPDIEQVSGINDRQQLAALERALQRRQAAQLMLAGVTLLDPERFDLRGDLSVGRDVIIDVNVIIEGRVVLGDGVTIGANCMLKDVEIGAGTEVKPMSIVDSAVIGAGAHIGPFARIRPDTRIADGAHIGNFVEVKKSEIGAGSKVNHLSYIGDTTMGAKVNIGAGTITCNYDGANKHRTVIGDGVFVGSDTQLVAPVTVHDNATIGAGSTITKDAPAGELTLSRNKQMSIAGWKRPTKKG
ncbi:MAG: UDP-N-acetylglucosamine diphosphorylase/glucosamine-1-phosphate N-acetyltransferase [Gammaproteobacteria bacterium HGW-Gammaproteobacteria-1]|nr:MAG: UDP-N-acetylglucosamine diphosphorylase/glucosamine-1-phosphate N-acetyltransferase [Gammaproteobacteria bacterium HGW-Gammaproteobacteria-1]